jgi:SanA protein
MIFLAFVISYTINRIVIRAADRYNFSDINKIPAQKVGLLLGTSKFTNGNRINLFYKYRIEAAVKLYKAGKIKYILISGDNGTKSYNEPKTIKADLIANGIPEDKIVLDYAGFRTYDSVIRAKKVFGQNSFIVISQEFHNQRAIYIARKNKIKGYAFAAKNVGASYGRKTMLREYFAKVKAYLDVLFNKEPKFLGDHIKIG